MVKVSQLPSDTAPTTTDNMIVNDVETAATKKITLQQLITLAFNNVPSGAIPGSIFDYVISGGVWTADSAGVNRNASMTAITIYINSRSIAITAVTARTFTASKDTYIDILDNLDGTGTLVYTEVANNAASPALAANSARIGIIVTAAGSIAAAGSVNQGQVEKVLPIASSQPYAVTDSLGNLICPRDPGRKLLGYRQIVAGVTSTASATLQDALGLSSPIILPAAAAGRKVRVSFNASSITNGGASGITYLAIAEDGTTVTQSYFNKASGNANISQSMDLFKNPAAGSHTYKIQFAGDGGAATTINGGSGSGAYTPGPAFIAIELE